MNLCSIDNKDRTEEAQVPMWVTNARSKLVIEEKNILENRKKLTDSLVNYSCSILKKQFGVFQSMLLQNSQLHSALPKS